MPGWTWLQGGGGNSLSLPPSPSPHPSSFLLPLPALCLPPSFSSEAVESPRSSELRAPSSQSRLELNCASGGSWNPGPGAASPGLSPGPAASRREALVRDRARAQSGRAGEPGGRAGAASRRVREQDRGRQGDGREQRAEGRVQREAWLGGGRRPAGTELSARDGGPRWGADPGWPRVRSDSPAHGGGRASSQPGRPSPARRSAASPGHVSGKPRLPAARTRSEEEQERGAPSPAPGRVVSAPPPRPQHAAAPLSPGLRSLTLAPPRFWAHAGSRLCEFPSFAKFFEKERTPTYPQQRRPVAAPLEQTRVPV